MSIQRKPITPEMAQLRLEALCAASERSTFELQTKLRTWGLTPADSERIINSLISNRFVDDARFARAFVNDKFRFSGYGRIKIRILLSAKRIDRATIDEAIQSIDPDEYLEKLRHILKVKATHIPDFNTFEGRTKLFRFGLSRGFESTLVSAEVKALSRRLRDADSQ